MFEYHHIYSFYPSSGIVNQKWECRIYRRFDSSNPPSWYSAGLKAIDLESPKTEAITIDWTRSNDVYSPMIGSKFDFHLLNVTGNDFLDMSDGDFKEFRVDVINLVPNDSIILTKWGKDHETFVEVNIDRPNHVGQLYWRGFVHPVNSKEPIIAPPFSVKFTAVDGLAELGERLMPPITHRIYRHGARQLRLIDVIKYALEQTKTDLNLLTNSGIIYVYKPNTNDQVKFDSLYNSYVAIDSFTGRKLIDVLKGILEAFNCRLIQSNGHWYIYNISLQSIYHNRLVPVRDKRITWNVVRIENGIYSDLTEASIETDNQLRRKIDNTRTDLLFVGETLNQEIQQPFKSITCEPNNLSTKNVVVNPTFDLATNWEVLKNADNEVVSEDSRLIYTDLNDYPYLNSRSLLTKRLIGEIRSAADVWAVGYTYVDIEVGVDYVFEISANGFFSSTPPKVNLSGKKLADRFYNGEIFIPYTIEVLGSGGGFYNFEQRVVTSLGTGGTPASITEIAGLTPKIKEQGQYVGRLQCSGRRDSDDRLQFISQSSDIIMGDRIYEFTYTGNPNNPEAGTPRDPGVLVRRNTRFRIYLWYPQGDGNIVDFSGTNNLVDSTEVFIDEIKVSASLPDEVIEPTFTRLQTPFRKLETYEPLVLSETVDGIAQKVLSIPKTDTAQQLVVNPRPDEGSHLVRYFRDKVYNSVEIGGVDTNVLKDEKKSLEQVVTQLKLNDFRRRGQIFEGDITSLNNGYPIFPIQMIDVDFDDWKSGRTPRFQSTSEATIFWGGRHNLNTGIFSISTFTPNQDTDVAPENRFDLGGSDYDADGQLKEGYYTNRATRYEFLEPVVVVGDETPVQPIIPTPATYWYHGSESVINVQDPQDSVYIKNIRTDGAYTLRGEIYVGDRKDTFGDAEDKGYKEIDFKNYITKGSTNLASFRMTFNCPVDGNEDTREIEIELGRFEVVVNTLIDGAGVNSLISFLNQIDPDNTSVPADETFHSGESITGDRVEILYHRAMIFIRPYARTINPPGSEKAEEVSSTPLPENMSNSIIINYEGRYLTVPEVPSVPIGLTPIVRDQIILDFDGSSARSINIDINDDNNRNEQLEIEVTVSGADFTDIRFVVLTHPSNINTNLPGVTVMAVLQDSNFPATGDLTIRVTGYELPIGTSRIPAYLVGIWGGRVVDRGSVGLTINIANHRSLPSPIF